MTESNEAMMVSRGVAMVSIVVLSLTILPIHVLVPVHAINCCALTNPPANTFNVGIAGFGKVYWTSNYFGGIDTGWVDVSASVAIFKGSTVTFIAVPVNGHQFSNWVIDGVDQGSNNPFILYNSGNSSGVNVVASFDHTLQANPPLLNPLQYDTIQVSVQGSGRLHWSSSYGVRYDSGSTDTRSSIIVPHGATVTFTAVPFTGSHFDEWKVDSTGQGSINPYVVYSMYVSPPASVAAVFLQG